MQGFFPGQVCDKIDWTERMFVILLSRTGKGISTLQKPDKIYLENTNLSYALKNNPDRGRLRETFFLNQVKNAGQTIELAKNGGFIVNNKWTFEIRGYTNNNRQIRNEENALLVLDEIETGLLNRIPLGLFGFLH